MNRLLTLFSLLLVPVASLAADPPRWGIPPGEKVLNTVFAAESDGEVADWGIANLGIPEAWKRTDGKGTVVAVLDTGVSKSHRDLKNQLLSAVDFTNSPSGADDRNGHGTWCIGSIVAERNGWGMVGAAPAAKCRSYKVLGDDGSGSVDGIAKAIRKAADDGVDVISMSLGGSEPDGLIPPALDYARGKGVIIICAAGNEGPGENTVGYPGGYKQSIAVAAHDIKNITANFSSRGPQVFCSGPGVSTRSTWPGAGDGQFSTISGTSMACPRIAALALLWCASHPAVPKDSKRADTFATALKAACSHPDSRLTSSGYGKPDAAKLAPAATAPDPAPVTLILTELSLVESERAKLKLMGVNHFTLSVQLVTQGAKIVNPAPDVTPKVEVKDAPPAKEDSPVSPFGPDYTWRLYRGMYSWVHKDVKD